MPQSAFIVMAIEATRQIITEEPPLQTYHWNLEKIEFPFDLPLVSLSDGEESFIETSFGMHKISEWRYDFDVIANTSCSEKWQKLCSGRLLFYIENGKANGKAASDILTGDQANGSFHHKETNIANMHPAIEIHSSTRNALHGVTTQDLYDEKLQYWNPSLLEAFLDLPSVIFAQEPVPSKYRLYSIDRVDVT